MRTRVEITPGVFLDVNGNPDGRTIQALKRVAAIAAEELRAPRKCHANDNRGRVCYLHADHYGPHEAEAGDLGGTARWNSA